MASFSSPYLSVYLLSLLSKDTPSFKIASGLTDANGNFMLGSIEPEAVSLYSCGPKGISSCVIDD